ncbi:choice-of-anchor A family protein [Glycomyces harbinensis]|uniref:Choice-of-anchor A domain-containing protein n=1 Tax=Glycomyces harbinensis TaxID=58114 RepID=A0A1G6Y7D8_9ACTN|nr:choice-of-anchor A family protein [Glycomyces harbinensis]SDD86202.1 choice-of-anchor A domain-containing protein [Glycomyces harbinensis]
MQTTPTRRRSRTVALAAAAAGTAVAVTAVAATIHAEAAVVNLNPLEKALGFNAFVENRTILASTEAEGPIATGGDLRIEGSYNVMIHDTGSFTAPGDAAPSALVVGGRVDYTVDLATSVVQVLNGGYVKIGDLSGTSVLNTDGNGASVNTHLVAAGEDYNSTPRIELTAQQPIDSVGPTSPIDFADAFATFRSEAAELYACEAAAVEMTDSSGAVVPKGQVGTNQQIRITLEQGRTNVINLTGEDLNNMSDLTFLNPPSADTPLLVNVDTSGTGGELDWRVATQAGISGPQAPYMLWNFDDTTRLRIAAGDTVEGSILAPDADYSDISPANVEGQIIAKNANLGEIGENGGEIHHFPFAAELTCESDEPSMSADGSTGATDGPTSGDGTTGADGTDGPGGSGGDSLATTGDSMRPLIIAAGALAALGTAAVVATAVRRKGARS